MIALILLTESCYEKKPYQTQVPDHLANLRSLLPKRIDSSTNHETLFVALKLLHALPMCF